MQREAHLERRLESLLTCLPSEVGVETAPLAVAGARPQFVFSPANETALRETMSVLNANRIPILIVVGATRLAQGNWPRGDAVLLSTARLAQLHVFEPEEGVVQVGAGMSVTALQTVVQREGWELPLEASSTQSSVGGTLALGWTGMRWLRFGLPKCCVLGLDLVLADGSAVRCGGRVVKNVTGYDLNKLYVGSHGSLAVMTRAWLRLLPCAEFRARRVLPLTDLPEYFPVQVARRPSAASVSWVDSKLAARLFGRTRAQETLLVEFAGEAADVAADLAWLRAAAPTLHEAANEDFEGVHRLQTEQVATGVAQIRFGVTNSNLCRLRNSLQALGAEVFVYPGLGSSWLWARLPLATQASCAAQEIRAAWSAWCALAAQNSATIFLESIDEALAEPWKREIDVFGEAIPGIEIMRALKRKLDPLNLLNPGRGVGKI